MKKSALCVGINDYPYKDNDLYGCVNDAKAWAELLVSHFGFPESNVKLLTDSKATKANIMSSLEALVLKAKKGDLVVFTNSSHGTYVPDTNGDEKLYDQAICPYDCSENIIVDDELRELFARLADGVNMVVISDSCFSGTVTRLRVDSDHRYLRKRFLDPFYLDKAIAKCQKIARSGSKVKYPVSKMKEVLLSGCSDVESSYDASIGGKYHGAMTYYALSAIKESNYHITFEQLHKKLLDLLSQNRYNQHPQLEGKTTNLKKPVFIK